MGGTYGEQEPEHCCSGAGAAGQTLACPSMEAEKHRHRTNSGCWSARRFGGMADIRRRTPVYIQRRRSVADRLPQAQRLPPRNPLGQRHAALPSKSVVHRRSASQAQYAASVGPGLDRMLEKDEEDR